MHLTAHIRSTRETADSCNFATVGSNFLLAPSQAASQAAAQAASQAASQAAARAAAQAAARAAAQAASQAAARAAAQAAARAAAQAAADCSLTVRSGERIASKSSHDWIGLTDLRRDADS